GAHAEHDGNRQGELVHLECGRSLRHDKVDVKLILDRIVGKFLVHRGADGERSAAGHDHGITVGRGLGAGGSADHGTRAGPVLHHDRLAQPIREVRRNRTTERVDCAACRPWRDQGDLPCRIFLPGRARRCRGDGKRDENRQQKTPHETPPCGDPDRSLNSCLPDALCRYPFAVRTIPHRMTVARWSEPKTSRSKRKPMAPITASAASMTSAFKNSLASKMTQPSPQSEAASISAPTTAIQARRKACRSPVMMKGEAPGMMTFQNSACSSAPMAPAARSHNGLTARTPDQALSSMGNSAA